ncbi:MAG: hypothetical protein WCL00_01090 [Bacteroidota bacterium]
MSFNRLGHFTLGPQQSIWVGVSKDAGWPFGKDNGTQFITADPDNDGVPGELQATNHRKKLLYRAYWENGLGDTSKAYWQYWTLITNVGSTTKGFTLQGGGVI